MKTAGKYLLLSMAFIAIVTAVSVCLPPGFLLPKPAAAPSATVISLTEVASAGSCLMVFDFEGERLEIVEPLDSCAKYSVGQKVEV